jgi:hypothetical protein
VYRVVFGGGNIEPCLLKAKAHAARSRKQIDSDRSDSITVHRTKAYGMFLTISGIASILNCKAFGSEGLVRKLVGLSSLS